MPVHEPEENHHLLSPTFDNTHTPVIKILAELNMLNLVLLFTTAILYDFAVGGAMEILGSFVLKPPLSWNAAQVTSVQEMNVCVCLCQVCCIYLFPCLSFCLSFPFGLSSGGLWKRSRQRYFPHQFPWSPLISSLLQRRRPHPDRPAVVCLGDLLHVLRHSNLHVLPR